MERHVLQRQIEAVQQAEYRKAQLEPPVVPRLAYSRMLLGGAIESFRSETNLREALLGCAFLLRFLGVYVARPPISAHEIPQHYTVLMNHVLRLHQTVTENFTAISTFFAAHDMRVRPFDLDDICLATVPAASPNAYVTRLSPSDKILVLFNMSIIPMICGVSRLAAESADIGDLGALLSVEYNRDKTLEKVLELEPAFYPLLKAIRGIIYGDVSLLLDIAGRPPPPANRVFRILCDAMAAYVVAHEFGHVMLGHPLGESQSGGQDALLVARQELEADGFAFLMNIFGQKQAAISGGLAEVPELFKSCALSAFGAQDLLLRTYWMVEGICHNYCGVQTKKSRMVRHPPYSDRLDLLKRTAIDVVPDLASNIERICGGHQDLVQIAGDAFLVYAEQEGFGKDVAPYLRAALGL